jgi:hypothetical protein
MQVLGKVVKAKRVVCSLLATPSTPMVYPTTRLSDAIVPYLLDRLGLTTEISLRLGRLLFLRFVHVEVGGLLLLPHKPEQPLLGFHLLLLFLLFLLS